MASSPDALHPIGPGHLVESITADTVAVPGSPFHKLPELNRRHVHMPVAVPGPEGSPPDSVRSRDPVVSGLLGQKRGLPSHGGIRPRSSHWGTGQVAAYQPTQDVREGLWWEIWPVL